MRYGEVRARRTALLPLVGGVENIAAVTHCVTRMRFVLIDPARAQVGKIEELAGVKGTFTQAGQFQVIIGNDVAEFYGDFIAVSGVESVSKEAAKQAAGSNQNPLQRAMGVLGEIFAPHIPALICGGLILGFRNIIGEVNFFDASGAFDLDSGVMSIADISTFWMGVYNFLWLIGEAVFHMLPVGICWSVTKKMGTTQILGIVLGLTLVSGQLLNGFSVGGTPAADIPVWDFGFAQVQMIGYQGQVIAALLAAFVLVGLEKFFTRVAPEVVSMIVLPFCSLVPAVVIAHTLVGPVGWAVGDAIAEAVNWGLTSDVRILFAAVFGALYAPVVMTGLHHMTSAIDTQMVSIMGYTILWPMIALSNIAQGSAVLAMSVLQKKNERARQVNIPACISCCLGATEPALFGVNLKYRFPLVCGMIGSACAAMLCTTFGVQALSIGVGGLPGILSIKFEYWAAFALCMGDGVMIEPSGTCVVAPADAVVSATMPASNHAVGLTLANGMELLIHVGIDTVDMKGDGFDCHVAQGDHVKAGDALLTFDPVKIVAAGHPAATAVVVSSMGSAMSLELKTGQDAVAGETVIARCD